MAVTNGWGQATQNNTNGFGKYQNTIDAGSVYADSYAGETSLEGTSAAFLYSKSSFHQGEADPTPTITGTAGGTFSATPSGLSINTSTGTIDLDNSTIQSYTITYTVSGVSSSQSLAVTASPFIANNFSMQFDGVNDFVVTTSVDNLQNSTAVSVSAWVKTNTNGNQYDVIVLANNGGGSRYGIEVGTSGKAAFVVRTTSAPRLESTTVLSDNTWKHIVGTWDGTNTKIYINGSLENTGSLTGTISTVTSLEIGGLPSYFFDGNIDEVAIWNTALSSDAVQEIYNATNNNTGKALDLSTNYNNYTSSANLQYWNRLGD